MHDLQLVDRGVLIFPNYVMLPIRDIFQSIPCLVDPNELLSRQNPITIVCINIIMSSHY